MYSNLARVLHVIPVFLVPFLVPFPDSPFLVLRIALIIFWFTKQHRIYLHSTFKQFTFVSKHQFFLAFVQHTIPVTLSKQNISLQNFYVQYDTLFLCILNYALEVPLFFINYLHEHRQLIIPKSFALITFQ